MLIQRVLYKIFFGTECATVHFPVYSCVVAGVVVVVVVVDGGGAVKDTWCMVKDLMFCLDGLVAAHHNLFLAAVNLVVHLCLKGRQGGE